MFAMHGKCAYNIMSEQIMRHAARHSLRLSDLAAGNEEKSWNYQI